MRFIFVTNSSRLDIDNHIRQKLPSATEWYLIKFNCTEIAFEEPSKIKSNTKKLISKRINQGINFNHRRFENTNVGWCPHGDSGVW